MNHSIQIAAKLSGLSPHVIRAWERRYAAIKPVRSDTNRRVYTELDIERLRLLRQATDAGHSISHVASLSEEELHKLVAHDRKNLSSSHEASPSSPDSSQFHYVERSVEAVKALDSAGLQNVMKAAVLQLGHRGLLTRVVAPLAQELGNLWFEGSLTAAHEHFATSVIKVHLIGSQQSMGLPDSAPALVAGTLSGQIHELGAVLAAAAADSMGWRVTYLGPNLPPEEIAGVVLQQSAQMVALSLVYPPDDPDLPGRVKLLRDLLPDRCAIAIGGRASHSYMDHLDSPGITHCGSLDDLYGVLEGVRQKRVA